MVQISQGFPKKSKSKRVNKIDVFLIIILITTAIFIAVMVWLFVKFQSVPDSLIAGFFALMGGECGILGFIKSSKEKAQARAWELEDRKAGKDKNDEMGNG